MTGKEKILKENLEKVSQKKDNVIWIFSSALWNPMGCLFWLAHQTWRS
jgi:hypothetical protein